MKQYDENYENEKEHEKIIIVERERKPSGCAILLGVVLLIIAIILLFGIEFRFEIPFEIRFEPMQ